MAKEEKVKKATKQPQEQPKKELVRHEDGTIELNLSVPASDIQAAREIVENDLVKNVEIKGFRKGKAPAELAKKRLKPEVVSEEVLKRVVTEAYKNAVEKHDLKPVITPQIHIEEFDGVNELKFTAEFTEEPKVTLGDYKKAIQDVTAKSKIAIPGKEDQKPSIDTIISAGIEKAEIQTPKVLIEKEVSRLLSQTIDELKSLGMTLEQYLSSKNITGEQLREEYRKRAERDIRLEFFLRAVADEEKITVTEQDITEAIEKVEDPAQRESIRTNPYVVAAIIRQQKTIDFLSKI